MEGKVKIVDSVIWVKHIEGDEDLKNRILSMKQGETIELEVDWFKGFWRKMKNGNNIPTEGVKPYEEANKHWQSAQRRKGEYVPIWEVKEY